MKPANLRNQRCPRKVDEQEPFSLSQFRRTPHDWFARLASLLLMVHFLATNLAASSPEETEPADNVSSANPPEHPKKTPPDVSEDLRLPKAPSGKRVPKPALIDELERQISENPIHSPPPSTDTQQVVLREADFETDSEKGEAIRRQQIRISPSATESQVAASFLSTRLIDDSASVTILTLHCLFNVVGNDKNNIDTDIIGAI